MANTNYKLLSFDKIPSTQTTALEIISKDEADDKTVVMAAVQTGGRGRGQHKWISPRGNLYASFIYKSDERRPTLSYAFAVAAAETLLSFDIPARIKWPNDLLAEGGKISGMLLEYCQGFLVVGIGINIKANPGAADMPYKTAKTDDYKKGLTPNKIINELIKNFDKWYGANFDVVRKRWTELSIEPVGDIIYRGKPAAYCGLSESGAMVLRRREKYELVYGDEVFA